MDDGNKQLKNISDVLVTGETDSPPATSGLQYFSYPLVKLELKNLKNHEWRNMRIH